MERSRDFFWYLTAIILCELTPFCVALHSCQSLTPFVLVRLPSQMPKLLSAASPTTGISKWPKGKERRKSLFSALDHSQPLFLSRPAHLNSLPKLPAPAHVFIYKEEPLFRHFWGYSTNGLNTFCKASKSCYSLFLPCCCPSWIYIGVQIEL